MIYVPPSNQGNYQGLYSTISKPSANYGITAPLISIENLLSNVKQLSEDSFKSFASK